MGEIPGPRGRPLLGVLPELRRDPLGFFTSAARNYGDIVALPVGPRRVYLLNHPDHVRRVLQDNHRNYRLTPYYKRLRPVFGEGLLTSEGDLWSRQRALIQPAFHRDRLDGLGPLVTAATAMMLERWKVHATQEQAVNVAEEMARLTVGIVARAMFGTDVSKNVAELSRAIVFLLQAVVERTMALTDLTAHLPTPQTLRFRRALRTLEHLVSSMIEDRRRADPGPRDLLSLLLEAGNRGHGDDKGQMRDEIKTMLVSGTVTTANALCWTWVLLARHPEVERRLRKEIADGLQGTTPRVEDLGKLGYAKTVIQETLRLFPPTWRLARMAIEADEIGGHAIPAGAIVVFSPYVLQRDPCFWDRPDDFDPERFAPERSIDRPRFVYFPFGGGPRACIGSQFAMMEMQLIVSMVAQRFRLRLRPGHPLDLESVATLRPRHDLMMSLEHWPASRAIE